MSYAAAIEPLRAANLISGKPLYRWWHAAPGGKPVMASNGLAIIPDVGAGSDRDVDMLFVCAGGNPATFNDRQVFAWLRKLARRGVTIGGISGGPYILARAGLLDGRRVTLHWEHQPAFSEDFPDIAVTPSLFEIDGNRITCSGGISALDMMVALIERDHGRQLAAAVGDWFLHTHIREGMGPQRMDLRLRLGIADEKLLRVLRRMEEQHRGAAISHRACAHRRRLGAGSSSACSAVTSATAFTGNILRCGLNARGSFCARPPCRCSTWRSRPASPRRASSPAPIDAVSASRRAARG